MPWRVLRAIEKYRPSKEENNLETRKPGFQGQLIPPGFLASRFIPLVESSCAARDLMA
jgi:hypothetical protein